MNIAVGTANVTYLSPADLRRLVAETLAPTSSLLDMTLTSFTLKDPLSQNYMVATGQGFVFDTATQTFSGGTITTVDFYEYVVANNVVTEVPYRVITVTGLQADAVLVYNSIFDASILNPLFENYAYNVVGSAEADVLYGGDGSLHETFDGSAGIDTLTYEDAEFGGVNVNLQISTGVKPGGGIDTILNIENVTGSAQADVLVGNADANTLSGLSGNDFIDGGYGSDTILGGDGNDELVGGAGNDQIFGGGGNDIIYGNDGDDHLDGGEGANFFVASSGSDKIFANLGSGSTVSYQNVTSSGVIVNLTSAAILGVESNSVSKSSGEIDSVSGIDNLRGTYLNDVMYLGVSSGYVTDNSGDDIIYGGDGARFFVVGSGDDIFIGGSGSSDALLFESDLYDAAGAPISGVSVQLTGAGSGFATDSWGGRDTFSGIEVIVGSNFNDVIVGAEGNDNISGGGSNDSLFGGDGDDILSGGQGNDIISAGSGRDWINVWGEGSDEIDGGAGHDSVNYGEDLLALQNLASAYGVAASALSFTDMSGNVRLTLTFLADARLQVIRLASDGTVLGVDLLTSVETAWISIPRFDGVQEQVRIDIDAVAKTLTAQRTLRLDLIGTEGADHIVIAEELAARGLASDAVDVQVSVDGLGGDDVIDGTGVAARLNLSGGTGNDTLTGGDGRDFLSGGSGDDIIDSSGGAALSQGFGDDINPGLGSNTIIGNAAAYAIFLGGIELRYDDVGPVGGITVRANADGSGTVVSGQAGLINDTFTYADAFVGTGENDAFYGGTAEEESFGGGAGSDYINGGSLADRGNDYASYSPETGGVGINADLRIGQVVDTYGYTDTLVNIEGIDGSQYDDLIIGNSWNNALFGYDGVDTIIGGGGFDYLDGGRGDDILLGEGGDDLLSGLAGQDTIDGGAGRDEVRYDRDARKGGIAGVSVNLAEGWAVDGFGQTDTLISIEDVKGSDSNDLIIGSALQNNISTLGGDDVVAAGAGDDWIEIVGNGSKEVDGEEGFDSVSYGEYAIDAFLSSVGYGIPSEVIHLSDLSGRIYLTASFALDGALEVVRFAADGSVLGVDRLSSVESVLAATVRFEGLQEQVRIEIDAEARTLTAFRSVGLQISGTEGADVIIVADELASRGIALDNPDLEVYVEGLGGDDLIDGSGVALAQVLFGGVGNDIIIGGDDRDFLSGGDGDDIIDSSGGSAVSQGFGDIINPGLGSNTIIGNADAYAIFLGGIELRYAGLGLVGGITVHSGINGSGTVVSGQSGLINDTFTFADTFVGTSENDMFFGGAAQEESFGGGAGNDYINGGSTSDSGMDYAAYTIELGGRGVIVDLAAGTATDTFGDTDTLVNIEGIDGSRWDDVVKGDGFDNAFFGYEGNDTFFGGGGFDFVSSGDGDDRLDGGSDDDVMDGGLGEDTAVFSGNQSDYRIRYDQAAGSYTVSDRRLGANGRDTLTGIEYLAFADGTVATGSVALDFGPADGVATGNLVVSGSAAEGGLLTASLNDLVDPDGYATLAYRWQELAGASWTDLANAGQSSLVIPADQSFVGRSVRVVATSTDQFGGVTDFTSVAMVIQNVNDAPVVQSNGLPALGTETKINTSTAYDQTRPDVTYLTDGGWIVVWESGQEPNQEVFGRRFNRDGGAVGDEFQINSSTGNQQQKPIVAGLSDGGWVVTWMSNDQLDGSEWAVKAQIYSAGGQPVAQEFLVNSYTLSSQFAPVVAALTDGGFVIAWMSNGQDGSSWGVFGQRYDSSGAAQGAEFQVNTYSSFEQGDASIAGLADGGWVITWMSDVQDGSSWGVYGQRFGSDGAAVGGEFKVNSFTGGEQRDANVTSLTDGGWVVVWASLGQDGEGFGAFGQRYRANGEPVGEEFLINSTIGLDQVAPDVTALRDGGFMVTWASYGQTGPSYSVFGQQYNADGVPVGSEFSVGSQNTGSQINPSVTSASDGSIVVVWQGDGQDGSGFGVLSQRFLLQGIHLGTSLEDTAKTITAAQLLAGATDVDGDTLSVENLIASSGVLTNNNNGTWTWAPAANDTTGVMFTYNVTDGIASVVQTATLDLTPVNDAPVVASTINLGTSPEDVAKTIMAAELLAGATDVDGDTLTIANLVASSGTLVANNNATWTWTPSANDSTGVTFSYNVTDGSALVAQTATLDLTPVNDAPIVANSINLGTSPEDTAKTITAAQLLVGATDADGDILSVADLVASSGTLVANNNATWTWTPAANDTTGVTFTYKVTDGTASVAQTATLDLTPVNDAPTGAVLLQGTARQGQTLTANTGTITDADGVGAFSYTWYRSGGIITGAAAATYVLGTADVGAAITARVTYTDGFGTVETLLSAATATVTSTSVPGVTLTGTSRADTLNGTGGDDILSGLDGNDTLNGLGGNDRLLGGDGNDLLSGGLGDDILDGGAGTDTVTYAGQAESVTVSLALTTAQATGVAGSDQLINVENLIGGNGNDVLTGNAGANNLNGGAGDDFITGGLGDDTLIGGTNGAAGDTVNYADAIARVTVSLAVTSAQVTGGAGRDTISGFENLAGSNYGDVLTGSSGNNVIRGGAGADRITGGDGTDYLYGDAGPDTFVFTANSNSRLGIARDVIFDLEVGDVLDFSAIDANGAARGNTAFINVGQNAFTGIGQLRMYEAEGTWLVEGNTGGTLDADFQVELRNWSGQPFNDLVL